MAEMVEWQPIETAPKDGRGVLVFDPEDESMKDSEASIWLTYWDIDDWADTYPRSGAEPTHWMPLPAPPALKPL